MAAQEPKAHGNSSRNKPKSQQIAQRPDAPSFARVSQGWEGLTLGWMRKWPTAPSQRRSTPKCQACNHLMQNIPVNVGFRDWVWLKVRESTCESVCLGATIHVNVGVRKWICLNVRESTCESVCGWVQIYMWMWVFVNGFG